MWQFESCFIPNLSTPAGSCLTTANWQEVLVTRVAYSLEALLVKPGLEILEAMPSLKEYMNWPGPLVLNAQNLKVNQEGVIKISSPFDGSKIQLHASKVLDLIRHLQPDAVVFPEGLLGANEGFWEQWEKTGIFPFVPYRHALELPEALSFGIHSPINTAQDYPNLAQRINLTLPRSYYFTGAYPSEGVSQLQNLQGVFIESDMPASDAAQGLMYSPQGLIDLKAKEQAFVFERLDSDCACPTCKQQFTQAYLHHLLQHTPLLCQRLLIQHNIYNLQLEKK